MLFGGGTPSLFRPESIAAAVAAAEGNFGLEGGAEVTLEANPGTVDAAKLGGMRAAGINRISFGAQSFNDERLKFLGRIHGATETAEAFRGGPGGASGAPNPQPVFAGPRQGTAGRPSDLAEST